MSTTSDPTRPRTARLTLAVTLGAATLALVVGGVLVLDRWGPGNMGRGFAVGALIGLGLAGLALWRGLRRPARATSGDRLFSGTADERDRTIATRAFAVLGITALPVAVVVTLALALGAPADATTFLMLVTLLAVLVGAFARTSRRS